MANAVVTVIEADGTTETDVTVLDVGRQAAAASKSAALSTEDKTVLDSLDTKLSTLAGYLDTVETLLGSANTLATTLNTHVDGLEGSVDGIEALIGTTNTALAAIQAAVEALDNAIAGSEMQVDIVSSALPSGAATSAKQDALAALLPASLGSKAAAASLAITLSTENVATQEDILTELQTPIGALPHQPLDATSDLTGVLVAITTATDTTLVSATSLQTIRVHRANLTISDACLLTVKRGSTAINSYRFPDGGGALVLDFSERPWWITGANETLVLTTSAAVNVDGRVEYVKSA